VVKGHFLWFLSYQIIINRFSLVFMMCNVVTDVLTPMVHWKDFKKTRTKLVHKIRLPLLSMAPLKWVNPLFNPLYSIIPYRCEK